MPRWLTRALSRIRRLASQGRIRLTYKALEELTELDLDFDEQDLCELLTRLRERDADGRLLSERTGEVMYVFKPEIGGFLLYLKVVLRGDCIVISFHEDTGHE